MHEVRLAAWVVACGLLGCTAEARIRLLEPDESVAPAIDASLPASPLQPEAGTGGRDAEVVPEPRPDPQPPSRSLVLRYDFSGKGDVVRDLVGDRHARLFGGTRLSPDRPFIYLDGVDDYVDIPNGVISGLRSATFIAWLTWNGGVCWQRIFDFGISDQGEGAAGEAVTSLFMTPKACGRETLIAIAEIGRAEYSVAAAAPLPTGYALQVALVIDGDRQTLTLYRDTEKLGEAPASFQLEQLTDANNWIGRSQWAQDAFYSGAIGEFRIYSRALSAEEIAQVRAEGFETP